MNLDPCLSLCMKSKLQLYQGPKREIGNTEITNRTHRQRLVRYRYVKEHSEQEPISSGIKANNRQVGPHETKRQCTVKE